VEAIQEIQHSPRTSTRRVDNRNIYSDFVGRQVQHSRSHDAVIRTYHDAGKVIETHDHAGKSREVVATCMSNHTTTPYGIVTL